MSSLKVHYLRPVAEPPVSGAARRAVAASLRSASAVLARLARRLSVAPVRPRSVDPRVEFYAEAGAPEGALYLDGELVGWVQGVQRL
jgi:hypothetical protein